MHKKNKIFNFNLFLHLTRLERVKCKGIVKFYSL